MTLNAAAHACPLCKSPCDSVYYREKSRVYYSCGECALIHLHPSGYLSPEQELQRYMLHRNSGDDPGYLRHLRRLTRPLVDRTIVGSRGLDFGCGPTKTIAQIMRAEGRDVRSYDPYFFPDSSLLEENHDFVACSEVLEHVHDPAALFDLFGCLLGAGGVAGFMTAFPPGSPEEFALWRYRRDQTHVCFYGEATFRWISVRRGWELELPEAGVAIFTVPHGGAVPGRAIIQSAEPRAAG